MPAPRNTLAARINRRLTRALPMKRVRLRLDRAMASITFDDFPASAWEVGGPILERFGARATYYPAGGLCGRLVDGVEQFRPEHLLAAHAAGHELGCHSFSHVAATTISDAELTAEAERNARFVSERLPELRLTSFAYPYGEVSPRAKAWAARRYAVSRGIEARVNTGSVDLSEASALPLERRSWSAAQVERWIDQAVADKGWAIFFTHDVAEDPSPYGATPAMLEHALETLARSGVEILPVKHAAARVVFGP